MPGKPSLPNAQRVKDHTPAVYMLHFDRPYWNNARHYIGRSIHLAERLAKHKAGNGSMLVAYAQRKGCNFTLAHVETFQTNVEAARRERQIKRSGHAARLCPVCRVDYIDPSLIGRRNYQMPKGGTQC